MKKTLSLRLLLFAATLFMTGALCSPVIAQSDATLEQRIKKIMDRPEFTHSRFGIKFYSMDTGKVVYELSSQQLFVPGSTTKLLTEGTALELLGGDYRLHTKIYRTGSIKKDGTLDGDLILVASGDYDLSNRIQAEGTLAFEDEDHSYGGPDSKGLAGDTLLVVREFAQQIADKGIKRVKGKLLVDVSLLDRTRITLTVARTVRGWQAIRCWWCANLRSRSRIKALSGLRGNCWWTFRC